MFHNEASIKHYKFVDRTLSRIFRSYFKVKSSTLYSIKPLTKSPEGLCEWILEDLIKSHSKLTVVF